jgi:serine/threonine protein phosphatase PrpC
MSIYSYSVQGKRDSNEDQHFHEININNSNSNLYPINLFCVFDGHGGKLVSKFLKEKLPNFF